MPTLRAMLYGPSKIDQRRRELRDQLWRDADDVVWMRAQEKGFTTVPRTLSLICGLIKDLTPKGDPGRTYLDLWVRTRDDGFVEVDDEQEFAFAAGYAENTRHVRTWRTHMSTLEGLGFIRVQPKLGRRFGYILLLHPHDVVERLRQEGRVRDDWWELFLGRVRETGVVLRHPNEASGATPAPGLASDQETSPGASTTNHL